jgi:hypothetical protein
MTEPDVTLTDYALAVLCAVFCALALKWAPTDPRLRRWWIVFFASIGLGALLGGTVHGFFLAPGAARDTLWKATLLCIGVTAVACWMIGARLAFRELGVAWVRRAAIAQYVAYAAVVLFVTSAFLVAIATYLPATLFLLVVLILAYRRVPARALAYGIAGLLLTFVAAAVQTLRVAIHPVYFNHNALYHLIQAVALVLIYLGARWTSTTPPRSIA